MATSSSHEEVSTVRQDGAGATQGQERPPAAPALPAAFDRFRVVAKLGEGGFGVVYKGFDEELRRHVAIKVPHPRCVASPENVETYIAEARALARLDDPGLVP